MALVHDVFCLGLPDKSSQSPKLNPSRAFVSKTHRPRDGELLPHGPPVSQLEW
jgi:hypothetical protein